MTVFFDGTRLNSTAEPGSPARVDEVVLPFHVAGIEICTTAGKVPPEYQLMSRHMRRSPALVQAGEIRDGLGIAAIVRSFSLTVA